MATSTIKLQGGTKHSATVGSGITGGANYVQIGKAVVVTGAINIPSGTATTVELVKGLPLPSTSNAGFTAQDNNSAAATAVTMFLTSEGAIRLKGNATSNISARFTFAYVAQ